MRLRLLVLTIPVLLLITLASYYLRSHSNKLAEPVLGISKSRIADNLWFPKNLSLNTQTQLDHTISAQAYLFVDTKTGEVLFVKNPHQRLSLASLVKIMTVIIALENKDLEDQLVVSRKASEVEPDEMQLLSGERLTLRELLDGVFLVSANDAAEVIAEGTTGRREEFINLMNAKAAQLGMTNTKFVNPTGLEEDLPTGWAADNSNYSTAYDIVLMSYYAISRWSVLTQISSQPYVFIPATTTHQDYEMYSGINLITTYPGVVGFKTGFTPEAGLTLVTLARKNGREVLGVLLGSTNRRDDARLLLDYSFQKLGVD